VIFSRNRRDRQPDEEPQAGPPDHSEDATAPDPFGTEDAAVPAAGTATGAARPQAGPYDAADAPDGVDLLDLGALRIPVIEGVEARVQADPEGRVQQVVLVCGDSALQLGAFAAPRTERIWDEVRAELWAQLRSDGFTAREVDGEYGVELLAKVRSPEGAANVRFVGIDGPRWLVRGVFQGPAALDAAAASSLLECLRGLVVVRGTEAMPAFEALPLRLPREIAEQAQGRVEGGFPAAETAAAAPPAARRPASRRQ